MIARIVSRGTRTHLGSVMIGPWERSLAGPNRTAIVFAARDDGEGDAGRLPPVVSSLFSIRAAHFKRWYQRHGAVSKGQGADGATAPHYRLSDVQATQPASAGTPLSLIGRIPTRRGIEWLEILRLRSG